MSRPATDRLKVNAPVGQKPTLRWLRLDEVAVDYDYQRSMLSGKSQTLIRRIAQFWDWNLCQPLAIAKRTNGALMIVDGQHRHAGAKLRGDIETLPCLVTAYASPGDEAAAFVALNQQRQPLSKIDLFKAALAASDPNADEIVKTLAKHGLSIAPHTNFTAWKPGMLANVHGLQECHRVHGARALDLSLAALADAFRGQVLRYAGTIFPGIYGFAGEWLKLGGEIDTDRFVAAIRSLSQVQWKTRILEEQARLGCRRQIAAKSVMTARYQSAGVACLQTDRPPPLPS